MHCTSAQRQTTRPSHATQVRMQVILSTPLNSQAFAFLGATDSTMGAIVQRSFSMARATKEVPCFRARLIHPGTLFDVNKSQSYFNFTVTCYLTRHVVVLQTRSFFSSGQACLLQISLYILETNLCNGATPPSASGGCLRE